MPPKPQKSLADKIIKASVIVGIANILLKFTGLIYTKCATHFLSSAEYSAIIVIAMGVAIPNIFARKWIAPNRKRKLHQLIEERKAKGKFVDLCECETK